MTDAEPLVLAIDQGTSATKAALVNRAGDVVARAAASLPVHHPHRGWVEQSPAEIWHSLQRSVKDCLSGTDPGRLTGLGLSTQRESLLLWDRRTGEAYSPLISWQDQRTAVMCREYTDSAATVRELSGLPLDPMFSATKARWLLDQFDPDRTRAARGDLCLGTVDAWILHQLTGEHQIEVGNASRTQLVDVQTCQWSPQLLDLFGVPEQALPDIVSSIGPFGQRRGGDAIPPGCRSWPSWATHTPRCSVMPAGARAWSRRPTGPGHPSWPSRSSGPPRPPGSARQWPGGSALSQCAPLKATSGPVAPPSPGSPS